MKSEGVRQCTLKRGNVETVAWIPEQFAKVGSYIRLLDVDGWRLDKVGIWLPSIAQHHGYFAGGVFHS
jgi:hypothetical protein